jgi:hypothetical protein
MGPRCFPPLLTHSSASYSPPQEDFSPVQAKCSFRVEKVSMEASRDKNHKYICENAKMNPGYIRSGVVE